MNITQKTLLQDAAQFIAGAVADGYGNTSQGIRLALALSNEAGEGPQMERAIDRIRMERASVNAGREPMSGRRAA